MIDPSIRAFLRSKYSIRKFFAVFGLLLAVLLVLLVVTAVAPDGWLRDAGLSFLGNFAATVAIFLVTYLFYVLITPPGLRDAELIPLRDVEISDEIVDLPAKASDYWFWGRSGSYFRVAVLYRLAESARAERRHIHIRVLLPRPDLPGNAARYKEIKRSLGEEADDDTLAANVIATVVSVVSAASRNPYLKADVALCPTVPVIRYDMSTTAGLITRDAKDLPAILINAGNPYFEMFRDAVENELAQSQKVTWDGAAAAAIPTHELVSAEFLRTITGLPTASQRAIAAAEELLADPTHRYAR
ncbi:MAG: hypothetical protein QOG67_261 [Verrucomicrobiota bacterium]|jgi:hypothetical protein